MRDGGWRRREARRASCSQRPAPARGGATDSKARAIIAQLLTEVAVIRENLAIHNERAVAKDEEHQTIHNERAVAADEEHQERQHETAGGVGKPVGCCSVS